VFKKHIASKQTLYTKQSKQLYVNHTCV